MEMVVIITFANVAFTDPFSYTPCHSCGKIVTKYNFCIPGIHNCYGGRGRVDMIIINDEEINWTLGLKIWNMTEQEQDPRVEMFHSTLNDDYLFISQNYNAHFLVVKIELRVWKHLHNHCSEVRHENKYKLKSLVTISKVFKSVRSSKLLDI